MEEDNRPLLLSIALILTAMIIWGFMYNAQFLPYDSNLGDLGIAFIMSAVAFVWLGAIQWFRPQILVRAKWIVIPFLAVASPFTLILVVTNYAAVFGQPLAL